jgi:hypothetical protein
MLVPRALHTNAIMLISIKLYCDTEFNSQPVSFGMRFFTLTRLWYR